MKQVGFRHASLLRGSQRFPCTSKHLTNQRDNTFHKLVLGPNHHPDEMMPGLEIQHSSFCGQGARGAVAGRDDATRFARRNAPCALTSQQRLHAAAVQRPGAVGLDLRRETFCAAYFLDPNVDRPVARCRGCLNCSDLTRVRPRSAASCDGLEMHNVDSGLRHFLAAGGASAGTGAVCGRRGKRCGHSYGPLLMRTSVCATD